MGSTISKCEHSGAAAAWLISLLALCAICARPCVARAQPQDGDPYAADDYDDIKSHARALLTEAIALLNENHCNHALHKLDQSLRLYDSPATRVYKAQCLLRVKRYVEAQTDASTAKKQAERLLKLAEIVKNTKRAKALEKRIAQADALAREADKRLCRLTIVVPSAVRAQAVWVHFQRITTDGEDQPTTQLRADGYNRPLPLDPGRYRVIVSALGRNSWTADIHLTDEGARQTITIPSLTKERPPPATPSESLSSTEKAAFGLGVVGLGSTLAGVGIAVSLFGTDIKPTNDEAIRDRTAGALVAVGVGATLLGVAGLISTLDDDDSDSSVVNFSMVVSPTSGTVRVDF